MSSFWDLLLAPDLAASAIRLATSIAFAALGAMFCERSGVINIALEGMLLGSSFSAVVTTHFTRSVMAGVFAGVLAGVVLSLIFAWLVLAWSGDQIIIGAGINAAVLGVSGYLSYVFFQTPGVTPPVPGIAAISLPGLSRIPWFGQALFTHTPTVFLLPFVVVAAHVVLFRTPLGLRMRVAGENPLVDEASGVNVFRIRLIAIVLSGILTGIGGVNLALENLKFYQDSMVAGRGFIALAADIFGRWTPVGGAAASLLFGFSQALMFRVQVFNIPQEFVFMLPYVLTILVLVGAAGRAVAPAALGRPFRRAG